MVKGGKLRCVSSMLDSDYSEVSICCAIAMNGTFVKENPVHAKKLAQAIQKALCWMRENPEECVDNAGGGACCWRPRNEFANQ